MGQPFTAPAIVVGIDGSRAAVRAALWAIDEALGRDLPLRLLAAAEPGVDRSQAETALREAAAAVASANGAVTVRTDLIEAGPVVALLEASGTAAMVCLGPVGVRHRDHSRVGSTAGALIASARCPVAVVRAGGPGWVVTELDQSTDSAAVLQFAVEEARMRRAPLRVLGTWRADTAGPAERMVHAQLDRRLEHWRTRYPDLDVAPVAVRGSALAYLTEHRAAISLVVVGVRNSAAVAELLGSAGLTALRDTGCSVLIVDSQRLL